MNAKTPRRQEEKRKDGMNAETRRRGEKTSQDAGTSLSESSLKGFGLSFSLRLGVSAFIPSLFFLASWRLGVHFLR
jgi:hypothetical protein